MLKKRMILLITVICLTAICLGCADVAQTKSANKIVSAVEQTTQQPQAQQPQAQELREPAALPSDSASHEPQFVSLLFAGDVMAHQKQIDCHRFGGAYDFSDDYKYIKDIVSAADIAVVNLETPMSGKEPYTGFPRFNAPDSLADALKDAGFDIIATANNHIRDQKDEVMKRTCALLRVKGFEVIGTASRSGEAKYALVEQNGIKIGLINHTVSLNRGFPEESEPYVNCMTDSDGLERGYEKIAEEINELKQKGAEFIIAFMHWGSEDQLKGNSKQQEMARKIADLGADLIIGAHPHVLQNVAEYTSPVTGKDVLIYYSLGNLVSNQPYSLGVGGGHCETGALAMIRIKRCADGHVAIDSAGFITTYVHKPNITKQYTENGETRSKRVRAYYIVPARAALSNPALYDQAEGRLLRHIKKGAENGDDIIGESGAGLELFAFQEYEQFPW